MALIVGQTERVVGLFKHVNFISIVRSYFSISNLQ